jgi:4-hydroxyphenylpyruvate dioxygenase-like putative hemolysin
MTVDHPAAFDALELWVADGARTRRLLSGGFGFEATEDGVVVGSTTIIVRSADEDVGVASHVRRHGDTVADVGLVCPDPAALARRARSHGLTVSGNAEEPRVDVTGHGTVCHTLLMQRSAEDGLGSAIDHVTYCLPHGSSEAVAATYESVLGLERVDIGDCAEVGDSVSGMRSVVLRGGPHVTIVLTEPLSAHDAGQTRRFLDAHAGPGLQHVAIACDDVCAAVSAMRDRGVRFLASPPGYHAQVRQELGPVRRDWDALEALDVLADADEHGHLFQLFTAPVTERGTLFFELIERDGARGFGARNVSALFAAVEAAGTSR